MPLMLNEVKVWNEDSDASYRLIVKDGDEIVAQTNPIRPTQPGALPALKIPITRPLTLIAERLTPHHL